MSKANGNPQEVSFVEVLSFLEEVRGSVAKSPGVYKEQYDCYYARFAQITQSPSYSCICLYLKVIVYMALSGRIFTVS